jgi:Mrp family chromosome partitioning ATPase
VRVLGEIPPRAAPGLRAGTLRRCDLEAFAGLLEELGPLSGVLVSGDPTRKRAAAVGLATAAAATGTRTALVECDLADPTLAEALGLATAPGLHEYLRGEADAAAILAPVAVAGPGSAAALEPLVCVAAGRPAADSLTLLESAAFNHATTKLRSAYDFLVLEGPPAWDDDGSLAAIATQADATLLCVGSAGDVPELSLPIDGLVVQG